MKADVPQLYDNHGRPLSYLRLAVTDRCNLRCFYCMPEEGINYLPRHALLSYEEMLRLVQILAKMGINKVRITGGEPFVRRDLVPFLYRLRELPGVDQVNLTTNGVLTHRYLSDLQTIGIASVNLSLDTLDRQRFFEMTRRDELPKVMKTLEGLIQTGIPTKINAVIVGGKNEQDIIPLAEYTRDHPVDVRYIEEMPFNGEGATHPTLTWNHKEILKTLKEVFPDIQKIPDGPHSTSANYQIPGHQGKVGIIAAFSRTFCGSCNRIRITAQGSLKTCLYDDGVLDLKTLLRKGASDEAVQAAFLSAFRSRPKNGFEAEAGRRQINESMSTIGG